MSAPADQPRKKVGYKHPPEEHQFKKGHCGNPKGRPKGKKGLQQFIHEELYSKVEIITDGRRRMVPKIQVIVMKLVRDAMKGDNKATLTIGKLCPNAFNDALSGNAHDEAADLEVINAFLADMSKDVANG